MQKGNVNATLACTVHSVVSLRDIVYVLMSAR